MDLRLIPVHCAKRGGGLMGEYSRSKVMGRCGGIFGFESYDFKGVWGKNILARCF